MKKLRSILLTGICAGVIFAAAGPGSSVQADWNAYFDSPHYAPTAMHQGYYQVEVIDSLSIDGYEPPVYILSVDSWNVRPDGTTISSGRSTYRFNYNTKEVWLLDLTKPAWTPITTKTPTAKAMFNKLFQKAYGIPFME